MTPKITVIVPTFNRGIYLKECLDSLINQTLPPHQIIVVNDGSTDNTRQICEFYKDKIEYFETPQLGKPGASNLGLRKNKGDYIWIFDDDDVAINTALQRFVEPLEKYSDFDFSYSSFFYCFTNSTDNKIGQIQKESQIPDFHHGFLNAVLESNFLGGAALFARTICYKEVGEFKPELHRSQDYDMAIRIALKFKGIRVPGSATFYYRQHEGSRGPDTERFLPIQNREKWFKYDQIIFNDLYNTLPLSFYLSDQLEKSGNLRKSLLQRMCVMASKGLYARVIEDLHLLALRSEQGRLTKEEYFIVRKIVFNKPYYNNLPIYEYDPFFKAVCRLSRYSKAIDSLRFNVVKAIGARLKNKPKLREIIAVPAKLTRMYI